MSELHYSIILHNKHQWEKTVFHIFQSFDQFFLLLALLRVSLLITSGGA